VLDPFGLWLAHNKMAAVRYRHLAVVERAQIAI
jgi:hypothetical protein